MVLSNQGERPGGKEEKHYSGKKKKPYFKKLLTVLPSGKIIVKPSRGEPGRKVYNFIS